MLKDDFDRDGFVVIPGFLTAEQVQKSIACWDRLVANPDVSRFLEDEDDPASVKALHRIEDFEPFFRDVFYDTKWLDQLADLTGEPMAVIYAETFRKVPRIGGVTPPHQDLPYLMRDLGAAADDTVPTLPVNGINTNVLVETRRSTRNVDFGVQAQQAAQQGAAVASLLSAERPSVVSSSINAWQAGLAALESVNDGEPQPTAVEALASGDYQLKVV